MDRWRWYWDTSEVDGRVRESEQWSGGIWFGRELTGFDPGVWVGFYIFGLWVGW